MANNGSQQIHVVGLFKNMAVLDINHHRTVMHVGDEAAGRVKLLAANSDKALFEINGRRVSMALTDNNSISTDFPESAGSHQAQLISNGGLYAVTGTINGQLANFVVDTGSTDITMSPQQAEALNLNYHTGRRTMMNTANGKATAHLFTIKTIRIGGIELHNVDAAVMENLASSRILLGMSFLNQVNMKHANGFMILKQRI